MPTLDTLQDALLATLGTCDPDPSQLRALGPEHPLVQLHRDSRAVAAGVPPVIGRYRRGRLIAWDAVAATWEGWDGEAGTRVLVRAARADAWGRPLPGHGLGKGPGWPHLASRPFRCTLADLLPLEDPVDPIWVARLAIALLSQLSRMHHAQLCHGQVEPSTIAWDGSWFFLEPRSLDPRAEARSGDPATDLARLGKVLTLIDSEGIFGDLGEAFRECPPAHADDARRLVCRAMADQLASSHHRIIKRTRARIDRVARLVELGDRLRAAVPPPPVLGCVQVGSAGSMYLVASDGRTVRAGPVVTLDLSQLSVVATQTSLDAHSNRALLRAWVHRRSELEPQRLAVQQKLGGYDGEIENILRWLAGVALVRAELTLLIKRYR